MKLFRTYIIYPLLASGLLYMGCGEPSSVQPDAAQGDSSVIYYCPMHPHIVQNTPGKCPEPSCMGMDLMIKMADTLLEKVLLPVNRAVLASLETTTPVFKTMATDAEATGYIEYDERRLKSISSLYSGRIEKLYIKYPYQEVKKGQRVFDIYSPELVSAQENLVYLLKNDPGNRSLIESASMKLRLLGFSDKLLEDLSSSKKVMMQVPVFSEHEGRVWLIKPASGGMNGMEVPGAGSYLASEEFNVKEGMYVMMGQTVFSLADPRFLVAVLNVPAADAPKVKKGSEVLIRPETNGKSLSGKVDLVEPALRPGARTMSIRVYLENTSNSLPAGTFVRASIKGEEFETLWIPLSALVDLGAGKVVWKKENGYFAAKKVETGAIINGMVEIADGLTEDSEIALVGHYMIDSEGFIKTNDEQ